MKSLADLESENAELRARVTLYEKTLARLLAEPPKIEIRVEKQKEYVYVPYAVPYVPTPAPQPSIPPWQPWYPSWPGQNPCGPWWQINPSYDFTVTCQKNPAMGGGVVVDNANWQSLLFQNNAGCAPNLDYTIVPTNGEAQKFDGQFMLAPNAAAVAQWPNQNFTTFTIGNGANGLS